MIMFYMVISLQQIFKVVWKNFTELHVIYNTPPPQKKKKQAGAELCQAQPSLSLA